MGCMRDYSEEYTSCPVCGYSEEDIDEEAKKRPDALRAETILAGRYIVGRVLSYTEYAITYMAWDALLQKRVAIKEYFPINAGKRMKKEILIKADREKESVFFQGKDGFYHEIEKWNKNQDISSIIKIYRCVQENGTVYMIMEYLQGYTLQDYIEEKGKLNSEEATKLLMEILQVIKELHDREINHWNLAPDNIYMDENQKIILIDPGVAKKQYFYCVEGNLDIYRREFIAPELLNGENVYKNADLYSAGAIFYFMLTGKEPKDSTVRRKKKDLKMHNKKHEKILRILMEKKPEKRPQDVQQFEKCIEQ